MSQVKAYFQNNWYYFFCGIMLYLSLLVFPKFFPFLDKPYSPQEDALFYFILSDLKKSTGALMGLVLCLIVLFYNHKREADKTLVYVLFTFLWFGMFIGHGLIVFLKSSNIFDLDKASFPWIDNEAYQSNFWKRIGLYLYLFLIVIIYWIIIRIQAKDKTQT